MYQIMKLDNLTLLNAAGSVLGCTYGEPYIYLIPDFLKKPKNKKTLLPDNALKNLATHEIETNCIGLFRQT